jgi:hypothetical protein
MHSIFMTDLQFFAAAEPIPAGGEETAAGVSAADAGQQNTAETAAAAAPPEAEAPSPARRSWEEVRAEYKAEFDAEVQGIVQKRLRGAQEKLRAYAARETLAQRDGALRRVQAAEHFRALCAQAGELAGKVPGFDLMTALQDDAFASLTRPGSAVTLEQAWYALHPELREREAREAAQRAAEAVSAAVRSGAARPRENGAQPASLGAPSYRSMSKAQREDLRRRIYAAGAMGGHLPAGG